MSLQFRTVSGLVSWSPSASRSARASASARLSPWARASRWVPRTRMARARGLGATSAGFRRMPSAISFSPSSVRPIDDECQAEIEVTAAVLRIDFDEMPIQRDGLIDRAGVAPDDRQVVQRGCEVRILEQSEPIVVLRLEIAARILGLDTEIEDAELVGRIERQAGFVVGGGFGGIARRRRRRARPRAPSAPVRPATCCRRQLRSRGAGRRPTRCRT